MRLNELMKQINEARGSGSFDYKFWFWAKKGTSQYGFGYARQNIKLEVSSGSKTEFEKSLHPSIKKAVDTLNKSKEKEKDVEIIEKKIKANTKRIRGIADLFSSPIVIHWLTTDKPTIITIPHYKPGDVTDANGRQIKILDIFRDPDIREYVTHHIDWKTININDEKTGDTLNTIISRFIQLIFNDKTDSSKRKIARTEGLEKTMRDLKFENKNIEVVSFKTRDYNILPKQLIGSKKIIGKINNLKEKSFNKLISKARAAF